MSSFQSAARDPIFWAHHANIDRLWNRWLQQGGGRTNPTGDSTWLNTEFTFFDENGTQVKMKGSQILSTVRNLCYRYDDDPSVFPVVSARSIAVPREVRHEVVSATSTRLELGANPVRVSLPVPEPSRAKLARALRDEAEELVVVTVEGVEFEKFPGSTTRCTSTFRRREAGPGERLLRGNLSSSASSLTRRDTPRRRGSVSQSFDITANARAPRSGAVERGQRLGRPRAARLSRERIKNRWRRNRRRRSRSARSRSRRE